MKRILLSIFAGAVLFSACQKEETENQSPSTSQGNDIAALEVQEDFNWSASEEVTIELLTKDDAVIAIQSSEGGVYEKGFIKANNSYTTKLTLPKGTEKITLNFNNRLIEVEVSSLIEYTYNQ